MTARGAGTRLALVGVIGLLVSCGGTSAPAQPTALAATARPSTALPVTTPPTQTAAPTTTTARTTTPATLSPTVVPTVAPTQAQALNVAITQSVYGAVAGTTLPGANCTAQARLPSGSMSTADGLAPTRIADGSGVLRWTYATRSNTTKGTGTHTVTCTLGGATRSTSAPFTVQ